MPQPERQELVAGPDFEDACRLVVLVHDAAVGPGEPGGVGDDGGQHRLQIEGGGDGLPDLPQCVQFVNRARQLGGALLQFLKSRAFSIAMTA